MTSDIILKGELCIEPGVLQMESAAVMPDIIEQSIANISGSSCRSNSRRYNSRHQIARRLGLGLVGLVPGSKALARMVSNQKPDDPMLKELDCWIASTDILAYVIIDGAFQRGSEHYGLANFLALIRKSANDLAEHIKTVEAQNLAAIQSLAGRGAKGIIIADDIAYQRGLLINPELMRRWFLPSLARQAQAARALGLPCFFHSDGAWSALVANIYEAGFSGLHCIETTAGMDVDAIRQTCGTDFCLWGHLDYRHLQQAKDPRGRAALVAEILRFATTGAFILGTTSGITSATDLDALGALYNELRQ